MRTKNATLPTPEVLRDAWTPWQALIGVTKIETQEEYDHVQALLDVVVDEVRDTVGHPLEGAMHYLGSLIEEWEDVHVQIPESTPAELLAYLMEEHGLSQGDLADVAPQPHISEILRGKRTISKAIAKKLAERFHVSTDLFP
jgi:HTH-type transcriptional regulator / antitoxin HigA